MKKMAGLMIPVAFLTSCGSTDGAATKAATANESVRTKATPATQQALPPMPEGLTRLNADEVRKLINNSDVETRNGLIAQWWSFDDQVAGQVAMRISSGYNSPSSSSGTYKIARDGCICIKDTDLDNVDNDCFYLSALTRKKTFKLLRARYSDSTEPDWQQINIDIKRRKVI